MVTLKDREMFSLKNASVAPVGKCGCFSLYFFNNKTNLIEIRWLKSKGREIIGELKS